MRSRQKCMSFHDNDAEYFNNTEFQTVMTQLMHIHKEELYNIIDKIHNISCVISNENGNIIYVNKHWENLCQYNSYEVLGKNFSFLQGKQTNINVCRKFKNDLFQYGHSTMENINYNKNNEPLKLLFNSNKINYYDNNVFLDYNYPCFFTTIQEIVN